MFTVALTFVKTVIIHLCVQVNICTKSADSAFTSIGLMKSQFKIPLTFDLSTQKKCNHDILKFKWMHVVSDFNVPDITIILATHLFWVKGLRSDKYNTRDRTIKFCHVLFITKHSNWIIVQRTPTKTSPWLFTNQTTKPNSTRNHKIGKK